ncbi:hypothetical protein KIN20_023206 [Parelaphostrongylus tenuis]|uniref:Uncharacterized protein n=1 Tax=Parelaphostrongylus tenuis TaxID=148309 RepID=A0AAD5QVW6_PARTN|nr:hypothetical protein KIN20_023206 [Parelaphostrongylus tenuis]
MEAAATPRENGVLPIGVFPGGYDNLSLRRLVSDAFGKLTVEGAESDIKPIYSVGDVGAGWFRHIEEKRQKLWYLGPLKRRWAYLWEMVKRSPADMEAKLHYEEIWPGC